jgi:hypothetical protein
LTASAFRTLLTAGSTPGLEMTNTAKRLKSSAMMSAPWSFTAVTIPESQERGAALEKVDLQDAIKIVLHSQQPGLFPTHIRDWLMVERKELLGRYSNKDSIKTAVNQALNTMIEKGEVIRQEATTDKGGRSHLYALLDVAQSGEPKFRQRSSDTRNLRSKIACKACSDAKCEIRM